MFSTKNLIFNFLTVLCVLCVDGEPKGKNGKMWAKPLQAGE